MAGNIYINEDAANADIAKIRAAITRLEEAQSSIKKLSNSADNMTGQTGEAIKEKCTTLDSQIKSLTGMHCSRSIFRNGWSLHVSGDLGSILIRRCFLIRW